MKIYFLFLTCLLSAISQSPAQMPLLEQMTPAEKRGQLLCPMGWDYDYEHDTLCVGHLWATFRADPWTKRDWNNGLSPHMAARRANTLQRHAREHTRLGIPLLLAEEAPHGHMALGATVFPTGLAMAATFDTTIIRRVGRAIADEVRATGAHIGYGPVLDLARDPRWSRVEETLGEDPVLTAILGAAIVSGMREHGLLPVLKHFGAYGVGLGGQNGASASVGRRELLQDYLYPFQAAIKAGAWGVMTAYNAIDGIPATTNKWLLRDILRERWGFQGLVVSDLYSINVVHNTLHAAKSAEAAAEQAIAAGVDIDLGALAYKGIDGGVLTDSAVTRVLRTKLELGLFDNPFVDEDAAEDIVHSAGHVALTRDVAREAVTLLKNDRTLPLSKGMRTYVCGPNADDTYALLGDYTAPQPKGRVRTIREAIASRATIVNSPTEADVIIAVVGGSSSRYAAETEYGETGSATTNDRPQFADCGEGLDRCTLKPKGIPIFDMSPCNSDSIPLVMLYIEGRPLLKDWADEHANAILTAYYPGEQGAEAIADVIFGDYNPAGRLPVSVPRNEGQLPIYYNRPRPTPHNYVDGQAEPLYPFGYGLSYSTFDYSDIEVKVNKAEVASVSFTITNTGQRDGDEVAQLYLRHETASVVLPERQLRHFARVHIPHGASRRVTFHLTPDDFTYIGTKLEEVVDTGRCDILIGASSADIRLTTTMCLQTTAHVPSQPRGDIVATTPDDSTSRYIPPTDPLVQARLDTWQDQKFGILLHWGLYSIPGIVESWSICDEPWITRDTTRTYEAYKKWYWGLTADFHPARFNPAQWADVASAAGMRYMLFTTKHHDGFCLWPTRQTSFHADSDYVGPVLDVFRQRGFMLGTYFSKPDWHSQDYWWDVYATRGRNVNYPIAQFPDRWRRFQRYTYAQIEELLSGYGNVDILWLDGGWVCAENNQDIDMPAIADMARNHQPGLIIVDRTIRGPYENYQTPERTIPETQQLTPWESCIPLSDDWGWVPHPRWKSAAQVIATLVEVVAKGGNLVIGIGPTADGIIQPEAEVRLRSIGKWLRENGRAIYSTRPTPHYHEGNIWFTANKDGSRMYAIWDRNGNAIGKHETTGKITWHGNLPRRGTPVRLLATGQRLSYVIRDDSVTVRMPRMNVSDLMPLAIEFTPER